MASKSFAIELTTEDILEVKPSWNRAKANKWLNKIFSDFEDKHREETSSILEYLLDYD